MRLEPPDPVATVRPSGQRISVGAIIEPAHMDKILGNIEKAKDEGATLRAGGAQTRVDSGGWFVEPTIFTGVTQDEGNGGGDTNFVFEVTLSNPVQGGLSVEASTADGTATDGTAASSPWV